MPKKAKYELIRCHYFAWRLTRREGVWYADGRTNPIKVGRHSLNTRDKADAIVRLGQLDESMAVEFGVIQPNARTLASSSELSLVEGRRLYEDHIGRSRIAGGVKPSTKRRYRAVFDKFVPWANTVGIRQFNEVDGNVLTRYASHLELLGYAPKTLVDELVTIKSCKRWLIDDGHLVGGERIKLKLRKPESQRAYCYRPVEVQAILARCYSTPGLSWLGNVVVALACTGMRIGELVNLKWTDVDFDQLRIALMDESGKAAGKQPHRSLKSGRSRSFPIHPDLLAVLKQLPRTDDYVLHGPDTRRLNGQRVRAALVNQVLKPLANGFPGSTNGQSFIDGRLHSFRHFFVSQCAASRVPERVVMEWVGHADSAMVRHYFHLHDEEAQRQMQSLNLLGSAAGWSGSALSVTVPS